MVARRPFEGKVASPQGFMAACLLLLLAQRDGHGYELAQRLQAFGFEQADPSLVYGELRRLEAGDMLRSCFEEPDKTGPARRVYEITPKGGEVLAICAESVARVHYQLSLFLAHFHKG